VSTKPGQLQLAAVVRLLELTLLRVGNNEYAKANKSFGLTTSQIGIDPRPDQRQHSGEDEHLVVFGFVPDLAPPGMIAVLLRPLWSRPVAWICRSGSGLIHTSLQAGGITIDWMRRNVVTSRTSDSSGRR
jgi:hypothetical protein